MNVSLLSALSEEKWSNLLSHIVRICVLTCISLTAIAEPKDKSNHQSIQEEEGPPQLKPINNKIGHLSSHLIYHHFRRQHATEQKYQVNEGVFLTTKVHLLEKLTISVGSGLYKGVETIVPTMMQPMLMPRVLDRPDNTHQPLPYSGILSLGLLWSLLPRVENNGQFRPLFTCSLGVGVSHIISPSHINANPLNLLPDDLWVKVSARVGIVWFSARAGIGSTGLSDGGGVDNATGDLGGDGLSSDAVSAGVYLGRALIGGGWQFLDTHDGPFMGTQVPLSSSLYLHLRYWKAIDTIIDNSEWSQGRLFSVSISFTGEQYSGERSVKNQQKAPYDHQKRPKNQPSPFTPTPLQRPSGPQLPQSPNLSPLSPNQPL